jgi:hypothetical protein
MIAALTLAALTLAPLAWLWLYEKPRALDGDQFFDTITDWRDDVTDTQPMYDTIAAVMAPQLIAEAEAICEAAS